MNNDIKEQIRTAMLDISLTNGYEVRSTEDVTRMANKFSAMVDKYGQMYCPCHMSQNADTLCPCKFMREYGACRCGLFKKAEVTK